MLEVSRPSWFDAGRPGAVGGTFDLLDGVCGRLRALISMTRLIYFIDFIYCA